MSVSATWSRSDMQDWERQTGLLPLPGGRSLLVGDTGETTDITEEERASTEPGLPSPAAAPGSISPFR